MNVLIPLPDRDFDVTEVAVPWRLLTRAGHDITCATEHGGAPPAADPRLLTGVVFGRLGAAPEPIAFYREMCASPEYQSPIAWDAVEPDNVPAQIPGAHWIPADRVASRTLLPHVSHVR